MRITKEMVGKKVKLSHWENREAETVTAVGEMRFLSFNRDGQENTYFQAMDWQLVEEPKKPSQRIAELIGKTMDDMEYQERAIDAIIEFLDEQKDKEERR